MTQFQSEMLNQFQNPYILRLFVKKKNMYGLQSINYSCRNNLLIHTFCLCHGRRRCANVLHFFRTATSSNRVSQFDTFYNSSRDKGDNSKSSEWGSTLVLDSNIHSYSLSSWCGPSSRAKLFTLLYESM
jgi:hypothetical protein